MVMDFFCFTILLFFVTPTSNIIISVSVLKAAFGEALLAQFSTENLYYTLRAL